MTSPGEPRRAADPTQELDLWARADPRRQNLVADLVERGAGREEQVVRLRRAQAPAPVVNYVAGGGSIDRLVNIGNAQNIHIYPQSARPAAPAHPPSRQRKRGGTTAVTVGLLLVLILCGASVTLGGRVLGPIVAVARDAIPNPNREAVPDPDAGPDGGDRLVERTSGAAGELTITVTAVRVGSTSTGVDLTVRNDGGAGVTLPIFGYTTLIETGSGRSHDGDPSSSQWNDSVPSEATVSGTIVFDGAVASTTTAITVGFSTVFGAGASNDELLVRDVPLRTG